MSKTKYPKEIASIKRKGKVIGIEAKLYPVNVEEEGKPLMVYDNHYSKFTVSGVDGEKKQTAVFNIEITDVEELLWTTKYAFQCQMENAYAANTVNGEQATSPAYTVQIASGNLKGKTPVQVLLEAPESGKDALRKQYVWLKENVAKYPNNQKQMDAIVEAVNLFDNGKLQEAFPAPASSAAVINLYANQKVNPYKKREDGLCFTTSMDVKWNIGDENPVIITISNFFAPAVEKEDGRIIGQYSKRDENSVVYFQMRTNVKEWLNALRAMKTAMTQFEMLQAKKCFADAEKIEKENIEAAKKE